MSRNKTNQSNSKLDNIQKDLNSALRSQSNNSIPKNNSSVLQSQNSRSSVLNSQSNDIEDISKELKETIDIFGKNCCNEVKSNTELQIRIKKIVELRRTEGLKIY
jgi:predicted RNase H-like nuclease (RuvC/YqgF family)